MTTRYEENTLFIEALSCEALAKEFGTPTFIYSADRILKNFSNFKRSFEPLDPMVCYAVKANSNLGVLGLLAEAGAGFDIVSGGELQRVIAAGGAPSKTVFSGVGKQRWEIELALKHKIYCFNVESRSELVLINEIAAALKVDAPVSIRVNPDVDPGTHPYIATGLKENKFGVPYEEAIALYLEARDLNHVEIRGIDYHLGSQIDSLEPYAEGLAKILELIDQLAREEVILEHVDIGGGMGITYKDEQALDPAELASAVYQQLGNRNIKLLMEPGRSIVADAGTLLTRVITLKENHRGFAIVDAAMNDLIRPALYEAWQNVIPATRREGNARTFNIVGPICESGDFLAKDRELNLEEGDLLAIETSGAYGFVMSSNYNTRNRAAEVIVKDGIAHCVRQRETFEDQIKLESTVPKD